MSGETKLTSYLRRDYPVHVLSEGKYFLYSTEYDWARLEEVELDNRFYIESHCICLHYPEGEPYFIGFRLNVTKNGQEVSLPEVCVELDYDEGKTASVNHIEENFPEKLTPVYEKLIEYANLLAEDLTNGLIKAPNLQQAPVEEATA